jgi:hypothetical protein
VWKMNRKIGIIDNGQPICFFIAHDMDSTDRRSGNNASYHPARQ